jgi:trk system potassium uptake protein TrkA
MRIVIAGASEEGLHLAGLLSERRYDVVLIDRDPVALAKAEESLDVATLQGDATHRSVLAASQVGNARGFVALTDSDSDNMLSAALAKTLGVEVVVARVDAPAFYSSPGAVEAGVIGVDVVVCATWLATSSLVNLLLGVSVPYSRSFAFNAVRVALFEIAPGAPLDGKPLTAAEVGHDARAVAVVRDGFLRPPTYVARLDAGDRVLIAGRGLHVLDAWHRIMSLPASRRALIVGGGDVGAQLAATLGPRISRVEVIEKDAAQAEALAASVAGVAVLAGDARSAAFLQDQQIGAVEYLLAVTGDDEVNLLVSLLGLKLGVSNTFTLLHRPGYAELYAELGIAGSIGTYDLVARAISDAIAPHGLIRVEKLPGTGYLVVELRLPREIGASERPLTLKELPLPHDVLPLAAARGPLALALAPELSFRGGETLVLACPRGDEKELETLLTQFVRRRAR